MPDTNVVKDKSTEKKKGRIRKFFDFIYNAAVIVISKLFPKKNKEGYVSSSVKEAPKTIDNENIYEDIEKYRKNSIYSSAEENIYEEIDNENIANDKRNSIYSSLDKEDFKQSKEDTYEATSENIYEDIEKYSKNSRENECSNTEKNKTTLKIENNKQFNKYNQLQTEKVNSTNDKDMYLTGEKLVEAKFIKHREERKKEKSQNIYGPIDGALYATVNKTSRSQSASKKEEVRDQDEPVIVGVGAKKNDTYLRPTDQYNKYTSKIKEEQHSNKEKQNSIT